MDGLWQEERLGNRGAPRKEALESYALARGARIECDDAAVGFEKQVAGGGFGEDGEPAPEGSGRGLNSHAIRRVAGKWLGIRLRGWERLEWLLGEGLLDRKRRRGERDGEWGLGGGRSKTLKVGWSFPVPDVSVVPEVPADLKLPQNYNQMVNTLLYCFFVLMS